MQEIEFESDDCKVTYKFRPAKQDRKHLIVIFSGFRNKDTYDFDGSVIDGLRSNILWIKDVFNDEYAYYLYSQNKDLTISIYNLIEKIRIDLGLEKSHVTLTGFSKGGTAALYYGIKYNYTNIVSTVPQFKIGSYLKNHWPHVLPAMLDSSQGSVDHLDSILGNVLNSDSLRTKNIYLFTSPSDEQYKTEILPNLYLFKKYTNFNYIETASPLVTQHNEVTRYNVPLILSIFAALSEGAAPSYGFVKNGSLNFGSSVVQPTIKSVQERRQMVSKITSVRLERGRLFLEGHAFILGHEAKTYGDVETTLVLRSSTVEQNFKLGGIIKAGLSEQYYEVESCDYSAANFATIGRMGIDLSGLPIGRSKISIRVAHADNEIEGDFPRVQVNQQSVIYENNLYKLESNNEGLFVIKRSVVNYTPIQNYFELKNIWTKGEKFHLDGYFILYGQPTPNWNDIVYYLLAKNLMTGKIDTTLRLANASRPNASTLIGDEWNDYSKSYFATPKYEGVTMDDLGPGQYEILISAETASMVTTNSTGVTVTVDGKFGSNAEKISVGVIGSCVSRDNLNTRLAPRWKDYFTFHGNQYQMSIVSLMAKSINVEPYDLSNLDAHSIKATLRDFEKSYLAELIADKPEVIIVDLFADARFGCIEIDQSFVTDNEWKLRKANAYNELDQNRVFSMASNETEYLELFTTASRAFERFRIEHLPETKIVLNSARAIYGYFDNGQYFNFSREIQDSLNERWQTLDEIFATVVDIIPIKIDDSLLASYKDHPWGKANVHYEPVFYNMFTKKLLEKLDYSRNLDLTS